MSEAANMLIIIALILRIETKILMKLTPMMILLIVMACQGCLLANSEGSHKNCSTIFIAQKGQTGPALPKAGDDTGIDLSGFINRE